MAPGRKPTGTTVRLRPADPFDLIRWLARSQGDPRKAVAELVQNSLDAGAKKIRVSRRKLKGAHVLSVVDDGEGVIPELGREEALHYLATHIGHSRKMNLTPRQRAERVVAGQYGVGLLGFWAVGHHLELRSRLKGGEVWVLRLTEDKEQASIDRIAPGLDAPDTYTEVVVFDLCAMAQRALPGKRLAEYLSAELRGQLLSRDVEVSVYDGQARGMAQRLFAVVPRRFVGEKLAVPPQWEVPGFAPIRVELHLAAGSEAPAVQVACAGTLVADDIRELAALGLDESPWVGRGLSGLLDFPAFHVPPGTRRGVMPDDAARAFADAMDGLAETVSAELDRLEREKKRAANRDVVKELRRALKGFQQRLPQYDLPNVPDGVGTGSADDSGVPMASEPDEPSEAPVVELFPPGPVATLRIEPATVQIAPGAERRIRAIALDAEGRSVAAQAEFSWWVEGSDFTLQGRGSRPAICAGAAARPGSTGRAFVEVQSGGARVSAEAALEVGPPVDETEGSTLGIPDPQLVSEPTGLWRSRLAGDVWEVNEAHEDYVRLRSEPKARVRYLLTLLAKELVQRSFAQPGSEGLLERMVEILAHAERNLRGS